MPKWSIRNYCAMRVFIISADWQFILPIICDVQKFGTQARSIWFLSRLAASSARWNTPWHICRSQPFTYVWEGSGIALQVTHFSRLPYLGQIHLSRHLVPSGILALVRRRNGAFNRRELHIFFPPQRCPFLWGFKWRVLTAIFLNHPFILARFWATANVVHAQRLYRRVGRLAIGLDARKHGCLLCLGYYATVRSIVGEFQKMKTHCEHVRDESICAVRHRCILIYLFR